MGALTRLGHASSLLGLGAIAAGGALAYRARYINPYAPRLERVTFRLPPGHEGLDGLTIGFVTDTHIGPFITPEDVARATALLAAEHPDLVLFGGDYISESPRFAPSAAEVLGALARRAPLGGYAVLGNHDLSLSEAKITTALKAAGIPTLRNQAVAIETGQATLWLAGIDDTLISSPDPIGTLAQVPAGAAALALWHEPEFAEQAAAAGAFAQLSGHSHGGQIRLPFIGELAVPLDGHRYVVGLNDAAGMPVYTSRGVGVYRPPLRFNCPPEVTLVRLARGLLPDKHSSSGGEPVSGTHAAEV